MFLENGIFRTTNTERDDQDFILKPNPASDKVEISLLNKEEGICNIKITDPIEKELLTQIFNCENKKADLDISEFAQGVHIVHVQKNNEWSKTQKLIISR